MVGFRTDYEYEKQRYGFIGGHLDKIFKIDVEKLFDTKKHQCYAKKPCMVGIHAFVSLEEQLKYRKLEISDEHAPEETDMYGGYKKIIEQAKHFNLSLKEQYEMSCNDFLLELNSKGRKGKPTEFYKYLKRQNKKQPGWYKGWF